MQPNLIDIDVFMDKLKAEGLVIVKAEQLAATNALKINELRRRYTKKTHLTFKQILEIDVLPIKSKSGLQRWIDEGVIKSDEIYKTTSGVRKIATSFLVRNDYL